jgi:hypothetical protein
MFFHYFKTPFTNAGYLATMLLITSAFAGLRLAGGKFLIKTDRSLLPTMEEPVKIEKTADELEYIERRKLREKLRREVLGSLNESDSANIEDSGEDQNDGLDDIEREIGIR